MATPYTDLEFSTFQHLILLRTMYFGISKQALRNKHYNKFLLYYSLVQRSHKNCSRYTLNEKGRMYLRYKRRAKIRYWIPVIISIFALLGGYDIYTNPFLEQLLQEVVTLWNTIWESLGVFF